MTEARDRAAAAPAEGLFAGCGAMGEVFAAQDWAATPVGPVATWPVGLRSVVRILLTSRFSMWMGWGPQLAFFYNDAYRRDTLRDKHPWALGRPAREVWAEIWDDIGPRIQSVRDTGQATWDEGLRLFLERSGYTEESYHTFSYSPLGEEPGRIDGFLCVVTETTERVLSERRLRVLSELGDVSAVSAPTVEDACTTVLSVLARSRADVPFGSIYLTDPQGGPMRRAGFYGLADDPRIAPAELGGDLAWPVRRLLADGHPQVRSGLAEQLGDLFTGVTPDGFPPGVVPDTVMAIPLAGGGGGEPAGIFFAGVSPFRALDDDYQQFLDLAGRQVATAIADAAAFQAQRQRADELAELDRAKTEFFTGVSHELRTPLTLIAAPAEDSLADLEHPLPPQQRERIEMVARNSGRLRRLVDTILDFARLEGGRLVADLVPVDLAALTRGIAESFAPAVSRAGLRFDVECADLPAAVGVDVAMWEKIVLNLLSNAVKYTLEGEVRLVLRSAQSGGVELVVSDTGIGIAQSEHPLLFQRFHRVRGAVGRSHEGSGIGLALVAELVALHGGTVRVSGAAGEGSAFTVALPPSALADGPATGGRASGIVALYRDEALQWSGDDDTRLPELGASGAATVDAGPAAGATVLVAEDNPDLRRFLATLLSPSYRVLLAEDGLAALRLISDEAPDLLLTDVMMPRMDGLELLAALRADPATATIPVVMLSAKAGEEASAKGLASGADDYLVKPFSSHDLLARVRSNLMLARLRSDEGAWRSAMMNALQDGFFVADADGTVREINDAFAAILGYGTEGLPYSTPHPWWPDPELDPEGYAQVMAGFARTRDDGHGRYLLPLQHRDGRRVWAECSADPVPARDGSGRMLIGAVRDVTALHRGDERERLLAESGRLLIESGDLHARLQDLVTLAAPVVGDLAVVSLARPDGTFRPVAAAHRTDPEIAARTRALPPHRIPSGLAASYRAGHAFLSEVSDDLLVHSSIRDTDRAVRGGIPATTALIAPMVLAGRHLGSLTFAHTADAEPGRHFDAADLALAEELARRIAGVVEAERLATREQHLHVTTTALAAAATLGEAAAAIAAGVVQAVGASGVAVYLQHADEQRLDLVDTAGYPPQVAAAFGSIRADADLPVALAAGTGEPVWLRDQEAWRDRYPHMAVAPADTGAQAIVALPLTVGRRVVGVLAASFPTPREFPPDERSFVLTLISQAAQAFDRAAVADTRWQIARTLQESMLPAVPPDLPHLRLAVRYLAATKGTQAGGDWYDLLELDEDRVAIVVGDVVGHGPSAAAVMGQLRSALAAYLVQDSSPADALRLLTRFARRIDGALASTAICVVLDTRTGLLRWARAGHPPPLIVDPARAGGGTRYLEEARGPVLGLDRDIPFTEAQAVLPAGASLVLYTDGLVERRGEDLDDGLDRLAAAARRPELAPAALIDTLLDRVLIASGPTDDVALIAVRRRPPPLHGARRAIPEELAAVRREIEEWAAATGLGEEAGEDLKLTVGEAAANSVEHAYQGVAPGEVRYHLDEADGMVHVEVADDGTWMPPAADPGYRGRGLIVIRALGRDVDVDTSGPGTIVRFSVPVPPVDPAADGGRRTPAHRADEPHRPGRLSQRLEGSVLQLDLAGELDLPGVAGIRPAVLGAVGVHRGRIVVDLREVDYLCSAGVGMLAEVGDLAREDVELRVSPGSGPARIVEVTGLDQRFATSVSTGGDAGTPHP
jgi:anti-anti-sigma factor